MSDFNKQLIFDLSKKYTFENFDFQNQSPEDLILKYQEVSQKIEKVILDQEKEIAEHNQRLFNTLTF